MKMSCQSSNDFCCSNNAKTIKLEDLEVTFKEGESYIVEFKENLDKELPPEVSACPIFMIQSVS